MLAFEFIERLDKFEFQTYLIAHVGTNAKVTGRRRRSG